MKKAIYAFSGDPITYGHIDVIKRAIHVFDEVTVAIGINPEKKYMFSLAERTLMARRSLEHLRGVRVVAFEGLLVDYAFENNIPVIIKGLRNSKDFDYELVLHQMSKSQQMDIDTFFLPAKQDLVHISSSSAKGLQREQGLIHEYVPLYVKQCLESKITGQYIIGVTGEIGAGKSYICKRFEEIGRELNIEVNNIELDHIGHQILGSLSEPLYQKVRNEICEKLGTDVRNPDGTIDRKRLGQIVFNSPGKLAELNKILYIPLLLRLRRDLYLKKGIILFNAALIVEASMEHLCNNNVVLVTVNKDTQSKRLYKRDLSNAQIEKRLKSQYSADKKLKKLQQKINTTGQGKLWVVDNSGNTGQEDFHSLFQDIVSHMDIHGQLRFRALYKRLGIDQHFEENYKSLISAYSRDKQYHYTLAHVLSCIREVESLKPLLGNPDLVECALWYQRIVYNTLQDDFIEQSARYAHAVFTRAGLPAQFCNKVAYYIRCTNHTHMEFKDDADYVADIDLLAMGGTPEVFAEYETNIRREYYWMDNTAYRQFRSCFYRGLTGRPHIYLSEYYCTRFEQAARKNLSAFLSAAD